MRFAFKFQLIIILFCIVFILIQKFKKKKIYLNESVVLNSKREKIIYKKYIIGSNRTHNITVVSSYFKLAKSKHNHSNYKKWISNFFLSVTSPLVIFTDEHSIDEEIFNLRKSYQTTIYVVKSHWDILKDIEQKRNKSYISNYKLIQIKLDRERRKHSADLFAIWNSKSFIVSKIANENPYKSSAFIYSDAGAWRENILFDWPDEKSVLKLMDLLDNRILFGQISNLFIKKWLFGHDGDFIEGGFFMGSKQAIKNFEFNFWNLHDERLEQNLFVGKDETLMNILTFEKKTNSIVRLNTQNECSKNYFDIWFFYQYFLASDLYYNCKILRKDLLLF